MKNYSQNSSFQHAQQRYFGDRYKNPVSILIVPMFVLLVLLVFTLASPRLKSFGATVSGLGDQIQDGVKTVADTFVPKRKIIASNHRLSLENQELRAQLVATELVQQENARLRKIVSSPLVNREMVLASIVSKPKDSLYQSLVLDKGSLDGITKDAPVFMHGEILLGYVSQVSARSATFRLFAAPGTETEVVLGAEQLFTTAYGKGGGVFEIRLPRDLAVDRGDLVSAPGYTRNVVGIVESVEFDKRDPFQKVLARIPVNIQNGGMVEVLR